jgi:P27 family predicted phage terminase small subunit
MPGPPRKPTALLKLSGSWLADAREKHEPKPSITAPPMPAWLDKEGKAAWKHLEPILSRMRVLTEADGLALAMLCETWSRYRRATEMLAKDGDTYEVFGKDGQVVQINRSPYSSMQLELAMHVRRMLQEFGLTPAARSRIVSLPETKNGKTDLFKKRQDGTSAG